MKKRRYLKEWVEFLLIGVVLFSLMVLGGESEICFITSKIVALGTFLSSAYILSKFTKIEE